MSLESRRGPDPLVRAKLNNGDTITAGQTIFTVYMADLETPKQTSSPAPTIDHERLLAPMRLALQPLYMGVDTAIDPSILPVLMEAK